MAELRALSAPGEPDVFADVVRIFLADAPVQLSALGAAIAAANAASVAQVAHRLRGGALEIGALRMAASCAEIEYAALAGSLGDAPARAVNLDREFASARETLQQAIQ